MATVVVPYREGQSDRQKAWRWVRDRYLRTHPDWDLIVGSDGGNGKWCKAAALAPLIERAEDGVVIVADADVWSDGLPSAVRAVVCGAADWSMPHGLVYRLDPGSTDKLYAGEVPVLRPKKRRQAVWGFTRRPYEGRVGGGVVVAHRDTFLEIPMDPRFKGPGHEDEAWGYALQTLAGNGWQGNKPLLHLWHEPLPRLSDRKGSRESWEHYRRYAMANMHADQMRDLIEEVRDGELDTGDSRLRAEVGADGGL